MFLLDKLALKIRPECISSYFLLNFLATIEPLVLYLYVEVECA